MASIKNMPDTPNQENKIGENLYAVSLGLELGFLIAVPLVIFLLLGVFLDRKFGTMPLFLMIGLLLNVVVTVTGVKNLLLPFLEKRSQNNKSTNN